MFLISHPHWRRNAVAFTNRYINEGLRDRAITRDLEWGIDVPLENYESKKIYIWAENVLGYLSATSKLCEERGIDFKEVYGKPIIKWRKEYRLDYACRLIREGKYNISEISKMVGYSSPSKFSKAFKDYVGCTPSEYLH